MDVTRLADTCPRCGKVLSADAPEGLCAACLLAAAAEPQLDTLAANALTVLSPPDSPRLPAADGPRLTEGQRFGPYRIGRLLGRGGMGEVYEAEHADTGRRLALKVLRGRLHDADDRARFLREGQLAASVSHPHTVYIFGSEEIAAMPVISMELLPGGTLKDRVAECGPLPFPEAVSAVLDIIGGLDAAQAAGILHRDIKPSNCFIDADGMVKVGDFGLSISTLARDVQAAGGPMGFQGTPQFAPPEQLRGEPLDVRADIYAVGATLYYLLTGRPPFDARDLRELLSRVATTSPQSPRSIRRDMPPALASIVLQCLAEDRRARPASYAALADALRPFSSAGAPAAGLGLRTAAGIVDAVIIGLPLNILNAWRLREASDASGTSVRVDEWTGLVALIYYLLLEGTAGASLGKRLFGLRVATADRPATFGQIVVRTAVFCAPNILVLLAVLLLGKDELVSTLRASPALAVVFTLSASVFTGLLFVTARRSNGYTAVHDLVSGTRVVARPATIPRRIGGAETSAAAQPDRRFGRVRCGPFDIVGDLGETDRGRLLAGFDPVLRRRVWIHTVPTGTPPISDARRDVGRVGRLHWLTGRRSATENWDAYEAPDGSPWLGLAEASLTWPVAGASLMDLSTELVAAGEDSSMPPLGLDRIWIRHDGHAVLLDFPAPGVDLARKRRAQTRAATSPDDTPGGLLASIAADALAAVTGGARRGPAPIPVSAAQLLLRWSRGLVPPPQKARAELTTLIGAPDRVLRGRRAVPILISAVPTIILLAGAVAILPQFRAAVTADRIEVYSLLNALEAGPESSYRPSGPDERRAIEVYLAGRHGDLLADDRAWSSPAMQGELSRYRQVAARVAAAHPSVSADELSAATAAIAPSLERFRAHYTQSVAPTLPRVDAIIVVALVGIGLGFSLVVCLVSAAIVPGGILMRLLGLAVVTADGTEIARARSIGRAVVAWSPTILWFVWLGPSPLDRALSASLSPAFVASLVLVAHAGGAVWSILDASRGPVGRLTGTWIAPR
jgi:hypothetical protein